MDNWLLWAAVAGSGFLGWLGRRFLSKAVRRALGSLLVLLAAGGFGYAYVQWQLPKWVLVETPVTLARGETYDSKLQPNRSGTYDLELQYDLKGESLDNKYPDAGLELKWSLLDGGGKLLKSGRQQPIACAWSANYTELCLPAANWELSAGATYTLKVAVVTPTSRPTVTKRVNVTAERQVMKGAFVFTALAYLIASPLLVIGIILLP